MKRITLSTHRPSVNSIKQSLCSLQLSLDVMARGKAELCPESFAMRDCSQRNLQTKQSRSSVSVWYPLWPVFMHPDRGRPWGRQDCLWGSLSTFTYYLLPIIYFSWISIVFLCLLSLSLYVFYLLCASFHRGQPGSCCVVHLGHADILWRTQ